MADTISEELSNFSFTSGGILVYDFKAEGNCDKFTLPAKKHRSAVSELDLKNASAVDVKAYYNLKERGSHLVNNPRYVLERPENALVFNSRFDSGNLLKAVQISKHEYALTLKKDSYNCHWFYFSVTNPEVISVTFRITNMIKPDLLYNYGMQPAVYSVKRKEKEGMEWHRDIYEVSYTSTPPVNALSFTYTFKHEFDTVYFAYTIPYEYQELMKYCNRIKFDYPDIVRVDTLCKTIGGNLCPLITITQNVNDLPDFVEEFCSWELPANARKCVKSSKPVNKKFIIFTGRVHSGETVSSFVIRGIVDYLTSPLCYNLRKNFIFRVVPMLNPDGVKFGLTRGNLLNVDLNRRWLTPNKYLHPTIYYTKKLIEISNENSEVLCFVDIHAHSRKQGAFIYGCCHKSKNLWKKRKEKMARLIPECMDKLNSAFNLSDTHYEMERGKEATARQTIFNQFSITHSYTLEVSAFGANNIHMEIEDYEDVGKDLCRSMSVFLSPRIYFRALLDPCSILIHNNKEEIGISVKELHLNNQFWNDIEAPPKAETKLPRLTNISIRRQADKRQSIINFRSFNNRKIARRQATVSRSFNQDYVDVIQWMNRQTPSVTHSKISIGNTNQSKTIQFKRDVF